MQITPGPVGGEITPPAVTPPEGVTPPPPPPPAEELAETPAPVEAVPTVAVPVVPEQSAPPAVADPAAEAAALDSTRQDVAGAVSISETAPQTVPPPVAPEVPAQAPVVADQEAVRDVLSGSGDPGAAASVLEAGVADNHLPTAEAGDIAQVAAADQAAQTGPEPVPAPPEAAVPVTPETPDNLVPPIAAPAAPQAPFIDTTGIPASSAPTQPGPPPAFPVTPEPMINTTGYPLPTGEQAAKNAEPVVPPEKRPELQSILRSLDGDVERLYKFLGFTVGSNNNEAKTGEGQQ